jgi:hypothetical protein
VVEDQAEVVVEGQADAVQREHVTADQGSAPDGSLPGLSRGFHVRPVPIDEPISD